MKRVNYFDIAKGIGILLVVMGHLEYISLPLRYFIVSFHMPMFFIISGMLMYMMGEENKSISAFVKGKLMRIGLPYLSFSILYIVIDIVLLYATGQGSLYQIRENIYLSVCLYGVSVLWFLPAMFFGMVMLFLIRKKTSHKVSIIIILALTVIMYFLNIGLAYLNLIYGIYPWFYLLHYFLTMIIRSFFAMFYLMVGYYGFCIYKSERFNSYRSLIKKIYIPAAIIILVAVAVLSQVNGAVDIHFLIFGNPFIYIFNSVFGSFAIVMLSRAFENVSETAVFKVIRYYGRNSLTVMSTHINLYIMYICILVSLHFIDYVTRAKNYVLCSMIVTFVFIAEFFVIEVINRFFPFFTGKIHRKKSYCSGMQQ